MICDEFCYRSKRLHSAETMLLVEWNIRSVSVSKIEPQKKGALRDRQVVGDRWELQCNHVHLPSWTPIAYVYMPWMFTSSWCSCNWLMHGLTNGLGTGSSLAVAYKLLSWADRAEQFSSLASWHLDGLSFALGITCGVLLFFLIEVWFTAKWCLLRWTERGAEVDRPLRPRTLGKSLYKLC